MPDACEGVSWRIEFLSVYRRNLHDEKMDLHWKIYRTSSSIDSIRFGSPLVIYVGAEIQIQIPAAAAEAEERSQVMFQNK